MSALCPHCGYDLERDAPLERDGWSLTYNTAAYAGENVAITPSQANILYSLARANGRCLPAEILGARCSDGTNVANIAAIQIVRIRKALGDRAPIETKRGMGYRWRAAA